MNKQMIRFLSLALCLVMIFSLAACGKTEQPAGIEEAAETSSTETPAPSDTGTASGYAWKSSFLTISSDTEYPVQPVLFTDDGFYATGQIKLGRQEVPEGTVEEYEGQFDVYGTMLYFVDKSGKAEALPNYTPSKPYTIRITSNQYSFQSENWATLWLTSGGADNPRSIKLRQKPSTGQWFVNDIQYLSDIRTPASEDPWR